MSDDNIALYLDTMRPVFRRYTSAWAAGKEPVFMYAQSRAMVFDAFLTGLFGWEFKEAELAEMREWYSVLEEGSLETPMNTPQTAYGKALRSYAKLRAKFEGAQEGANLVAAAAPQRLVAS